MTMKLVKKTPEYSIFQRGDDRYAVKDATKKAVNGEEKVRILLAEGLITASHAAPATEAEAEPVAEADADAEASDDAAEAPAEADEE